MTKNYKIIDWKPIKQPTLLNVVIATIGCEKCKCCFESPYLSKTIINDCPKKAKLVYKYCPMCGIKLEEENDD